MKTRDVLAVFNRGRISRLAVARTEVSRVALSADVQTNWMPRTLGSMMLRPGLGFKGTILGDGAYVPFANATNDTAIVELSAGQMRVWDNGDTLIARPTVTATITNGTFATDLSGWTDADEGSAASTWVGGAMQLLGTGYDAARRRQQVTVAQSATVHSLSIVVERGPVLLRVGSSAGADDVFRQAVLRTGAHNIAFTPPSSFWVELSSTLAYPSLVSSCEIGAGGTMQVATPWASADACKSVRWDQVGDVLFVASDGLQQRRIERRDNNSWSVVAYEANDGPFEIENTENIRLTPSAISGAITLTASQPVFEAGHVGGLFRLSSQGQLVQASLNSSLTYTDPIRVTGVTTGRIFTISRTGTWSGTVTLQRSIGEPGSWVDVASYTGTGTTSYDDGLDNSIAYYRIGFNSGGYTSGTAVLSLSYASGSITGVVRVTGFTSDTSVSAVVLSNLGGSDATEVWAEGAWSDARGWPSAVAFWEGRLWWSGNGRNYASVSDALTSFDPDTVGDSAPINRQVGKGASQRTNWLMPLQRLIVGTDGSEYSVRSNSFDEPVTPSNYNSKPPSTKGSHQAPAALEDAKGYFIGRSRKTIYEMEYEASKYDYSALETTLLVPEIGDSPFVRIAVQQTPNMRVHAVREDGTVAVLVRDAAEDVLCWVDVETNGFVEDVVILPAINEDRVFYRVRRTINGADVRYHEEWAREDQCRGGDVCRLADSHIVGSVATQSIGGLDHLEGETVVIWADGRSVGSYPVVSGQVSLETTVTNWCAGLGYTARYKSAKLAGQTSLGLSLTQQSRIDHIGLILADTHAQGLMYGPSFDVLDDLPLVEDGQEVDENSVWESYDAEMIEFDGDWATDNRICLQASAPKPCTVLAAVLSIDRQDKA